MGIHGFAMAFMLASFLHLLPSVSCHKCFSHLREYLAGCCIVCFGIFSEVLLSLEILIYMRLRSPVDVFLSEENRPMRPVIVSPVNETMEVVLGKWPQIRVC